MSDPWRGIVRLLTRCSVVLVARFANWRTAAAVLLMAGCVSSARAGAGELPRCGEYTYALVRQGSSPLPRIVLATGAQSGAFLLDYGATQSSLNLSPHAGASDGHARESSEHDVVTTFDLPTFSQGRFARQPSSGAGVVGTDFLSLLSADFEFGQTAARVILGAAPCNADQLRADGLVSIDQAGYFTSAPERLGRERPNVPVAFLGLGPLTVAAQIDTGYDDAVYPPSIDINATLFDRLKQAGVGLQRLADVQVATCHEAVTRPAYRLLETVRLTTREGEALRELSGMTLIVKETGSCGGIGHMSEPAAQIGMGFLRRIGRVVFDPKAERVWIARQSASGQ